MGVALPAAHPVLAIIGIDDCDDLVGCGCEAVVVLVPHHDNRASSAVPYRRPMDGVHQRAQRDITEVDQRRVQSTLRAIVIGVEIALRTAVAAPVLVVALV